MTDVIAGGSGPRLIDGRFELLHCLGGGGMGVVWQAWDAALHRDVALKEVRPPDPADLDTIGAREMRQRVLREARALARLRHPNVVIIHHIVDTAEHPHPWLVMELVTGGSLADRLAKGPLTVPEAARIGRGVLSALRAAHAVGILHRDIKPGNVLLRPDGSPVLTDFGIAAVHDATALTISGSLVGSPEYIAPERLRGEEGNPASDLWSLAMMLYVAVEGRHPLRRATMLATLAAVLDEPLPQPMRAGPLGPALIAMLARDPQQRPNADQFDRLLAAAEHSPAMTPPTAWSPMAANISNPSNPAAQLPPPAYPSGTDTSGWLLPKSQRQITRPPAKRKRTVLIAVATAVLIVAGVLVWTLLPGQPSTTGTPSALGSSGPPPSHHLTTPTTPTTQAPQAPQDLLTPAGVRATIAAMQPALGTKPLRLTVYSNHATAEAPTAADPKLYDDINYQDGVTTHSPGGEVNTDVDAPVDLTAINWDMLPTLLRKAQDTLNVPHPTIIYLIVESDVSFDDSGNPVAKSVIRIYRADDYAGGMLVTDLKGNVITTVPRA